MVITDYSSILKRNYFHRIFLYITPLDKVSICDIKNNKKLDN